MSGASVPVGTVLAYAGTNTGPELNQMGWLICDGSSLSATTYVDLFQVIGTCNGGDGSTEFNLPDYRGYFLRGQDPTGQVDPDANSRTAANSGGLTGDNVGSIQDWATANAHTPFKSSIDRVPGDNHKVYVSTDCMVLLKGSQVIQSNSGGDAETRPVNAYVRYIIKATDDALLPVGVVVPYAGNSSVGSANIATWFLLCQGTELPQSANTELFSAIGTANGGSSTTFNLPDYRGRFLRGVANGSDTDPDASSRVPMQAGGNSGDNVGSIQAAATGRPKTPFTINIDIGTVMQNSSACSGHKNTRWNPGSPEKTMTVSGGDNETRPVNAYVDFYIMSKQTSGATDVFPIGGVIGIPGNGAPPPGQWLLCDGRAVNNSLQYTDLYNAIGHDNGGNATTFNIPNYQGMFLRGCDHGQGRDPDAGERLEAAGGGQTGDNVGSVQDFATAMPQKPISGAVQHQPVHLQKTAAAIGNQNYSGKWGSTQTPTLGGGDKESRPVNAYIKFYIKYALAPSHSEENS